MPAEGPGAKKRQRTSTDDNPNLESTLLVLLDKVSTIQIQCTQNGRILENLNGVNEKVKVIETTQALHHSELVEIKAQLHGLQQMYVDLKCEFRSKMLVIFGVGEQPNENTHWQTCDFSTMN